MEAKNERGIRMKRVDTTRTKNRQAAIEAADVLTENGIQEDSVTLTLKADGTFNVKYFIRTNPEELRRRRLGRVA